MNSTLKNILILLIILTFAFFGYYIFVQNNNSQIIFSDNQGITDDVLLKTQAFIEYRNALDQVNIDTSIFEDEKFISYRKFTKEVEIQSIGKNNPFSEKSTTNRNNNF